MRVRETGTDLLGRIVDTAERCGWRCYHVPDSRRVTSKGFPDLALMHLGRGLVLFREVKGAREKVTAEQMEWLTALRDNGHDAGVWRPSDWPAIEALLTGRGPGLRTRLGKPPTGRG